MAVLLAILGWAGYGVVGAFGLVSVAAGLFYLAELVEEYTVLTKRVLRVIIAVRLRLHSFVSRLLMCPHVPPEHGRAACAHGIVLACFSVSVSCWARSTARLLPASRQVSVLRTHIAAVHCECR